MIPPIMIKFNHSGIEDSENIANAAYRGPDRLSNPDARVAFVAVVFVSVENINFGGTSNIASEPV